MEERTQAEFYADLAKRFKYKPPTYLTETQALTYVGFTIREYRDSEGVQMRSIDCQQDTAKLVELAGIAVPDIHAAGEVSDARWLRNSV